MNAVSWQGIRFWHQAFFYTICSSCFSLSSIAQSCLMGFGCIMINNVVNGQQRRRFKSNPKTNQPYFHSNWAFVNRRIKISQSTVLDSALCPQIANQTCSGQCKGKEVLSGVATIWMFIGCMSYETSALGPDI